MSTHEKKKTSMWTPQRRAIVRSYVERSQSMAGVAALRAHREALLAALKDSGYTTLTMGVLNNHISESEYGPWGLSADVIDARDLDMVTTLLRHRFDYSSQGEFLKAVGARL